MSMNDVYYRFPYLSGNDNYSSMAAHLRMQAIRSHVADPVDFELWCTAVSSINACKTIAAVIHGAAPELDTEAVASVN